MKIKTKRGVLSKFFLLTLILFFVSTSLSEISAISEDPQVLQNNLFQVKDNLLQGINSPDRDFSTEVSLIYSFYRIKVEEWGNHLNAFLDTRGFIMSLPISASERDSILGSFYVGALGDIQYEKEDEYHNFYSELVNFTNESEVLKNYFDLESQRKDGFGYLKEKILTVSNGDLSKALYEEDSIKSQFASQIYLILSNSKEVSRSEEEVSISNFKLTSSYKALILFEDLSITEKDGGLEIRQDPNQLSQKKVNLILSLVGESAYQDNIPYALGLLDNLEKILKNNLYEEINQNLKSEEEAYSALALFKLISDYRSAISYEEFNKIKMDLLGKENKINLLLWERKGYLAKFGDLPSETPEEIMDKYAAAVLMGGFGKDILNSIGAFDEAKEFLSELKEGNKRTYKGIYAIQILAGLGIDPEVIRAWIDDTLTPEQEEEFVNTLLLNSDLQEEIPEGDILERDFEIQTQGEINRGTVKGSNYFFYSSEQNEVFDFLRENKEYAKEAYYSFQYSGYIKFLTGEEKIPFDSLNYGLSKENTFLYFIHKDVLEKKLENLKFSGLSSSLNKVDDMISPLYLSLTLATSGVGSSTDFSTLFLTVGTNVAVDSSTLITLITIDDLFKTDYEDNFIAGFATSSIYQIVALKNIARAIQSGSSFDNIVNVLGPEKLEKLGLKKQRIVMTSDLKKFFSERQMQAIKDDYYGVLGISRTASEKEIIANYKKKAIEYHPDLHPENPFATQEMQKINNAKDVLADYSSRSSYDGLLEKYRSVRLYSSSIQLIDPNGNLIRTKESFLSYLDGLDPKKQIPLVEGSEITVPFGKELGIIDNSGKLRTAFFSKALPDRKVEIFYRGQKKSINLDLIANWNPEIKNLLRSKKKDFLTSAREKLNQLFSITPRKEELSKRQSILRGKLKENLLVELDYLKNSGREFDPETGKMLRRYSGKGTASEYLARIGYYKSGDQDWLYGRGEVRDRVTLKNGNSAIYKIHISSDLDSYEVVLLSMSKTLRDLNVLHKTSPGIYYSNPSSRSRQHGKIITAYTSSPEDVAVIVQQAKRISETYGVKGISIGEFNRRGANLKYELAIPGTNNMVYYTIESVGENVLGYSKRGSYMKRYWGQGPLDNIYWNGLPPELRNVP
ncbi:MAG: J domain-containing protein [archaeon]|nr:J domain-containing protein [archaeon]